MLIIEAVKKYIVIFISLTFILNIDPLLKPPKKLIK